MGRLMPLRMLTKTPNITIVLHLCRSMMMWIRLKFQMIVA